MRLSDLTIKAIDYPLSVNWAFPEINQLKNESFIFMLGDLVLSECAPNIRYGETDRFDQKANGAVNIKICRCYG